MMSTTTAAAATVSVVHLWYAMACDEKTMRGQKGENGLSGLNNDNRNMKSHLHAVRQRASEGHRETSQYLHSP